jgi:hypothetical protein
LLLRSSEASRGSAPAQRDGRTLNLSRAACTQLPTSIGSCTATNRQSHRLDALVAHTIAAAAKIEVTARAHRTIGNGDGQRGGVSALEATASQIYARAARDRFTREAEGWRLQANDAPALTLNATRHAMLNGVKV